MDLKLLYALLLTIMPITELRIGLPLAMSYAKDNDISLFFIFFIIILLNILIIFFIFYFLDKMHSIFMKFDFYKKIFGKFLKRFQKKVDKFEKRYEMLGFLALVLFVGIPMPGTGVWGGSLIAWILDLDRKKSILAMSIGVIIAGILVFLATLGFTNLFLN